MTIIASTTERTPVKHHKVWDLPVRVFHWALAVAFVGAYVTNRLGVNYFKYHVWFGYAVIVLVVFRLVWGIVGTHHARFGNFVRGPIATLRYTWQWLRGKEQHHAGHNPLGAWMVLLLLVTLFVQAFSGLFGDDQIMNLGPLYGYVEAETSATLTSLHRQLFYWIVGAVVLHVLAVIAHIVIKKDNLVRAMITGHKPASKISEAEAIVTSRTWLAVLLVGVLTLALAWVVSSAPVPADASFD
jgi:cytochrome b